MLHLARNELPELDEGDERRLGVAKDVGLGAVAVGKVGFGSRFILRAEAVGLMAVGSMVVGRD